MKATLLNKGLFALLLLAATSQSSWAAEWGVEQLMQGLATNKGGKATFVEKTYMSILDMPLISSGELLFTPPDHLEKRTLKPSVEIMVLDGNDLSIERDNRKNSMNLSDIPEIAAFIESIRGTLAGDRQALEQKYHLTLGGNREKWHLILVPRDSRMATILQSVRIEGKRNTVMSVEFTQAGGNYSTMTISQASSP